MAKKRKPKQPTKQSVVRYHSDWLRLIERSGPFLSLPVLLDTFPQGPSADDRDRRVQLKQAYESWQAENRDIAVHRAWIEYVLTHGLEIPQDHLVDTGHIPQNLSVRVDVHHETLTPDIALIEPEDKDDKTPATPRMLVMIVPPDQALDKKIPGKNWVASPQTRMADLVRGCNDQGITFGLLTNGEQWMLVYSKQGETASFTTWYASIWFDEKITLRAFRDLLSARRFYGDPARTLDKLFERSADDQHEVTDQLGLQVRDAIETLVSAIDEIDRDRQRKLLAGFSEEQLYEACVTVMMRLVFLFFAEERRLLPVKESFYEQNYSLHTLFDQLQTQKNMGEEELEWAYSGWCRLLALFRAIHGGVQHDDMQLHAYGSSLFDPDRFPFLEGRPQDTKWRELESQPLPINDRTLLHVLEALKLLEVRGIGGGKRITRVMSFRELDVEDIGHIYESLLDHTAKRAKGHVLGIVGSKGKEPELSLRCLGEAAEQSREALVEYLNDETGKTPNSIEKLLDAEIKIDESRLLAACGNDQTFLAQVKPFANLVRENRSGDPIIIPDGSVYVTEGTDRRSSGTHYTPKSLTEPIVQYTLEPLVYEGPPEGKPQDEWKLKTPAEILELNICDMACGSGAFLVQACRYMAERLVEAWEYIEQSTEVADDHSQTDTGNTVVGTIEAVEMVVESNGQYATSKTIRRPRITPLGEVSKNDPSEQLIPLDPAERMIYARRIVADRCLYGVDINPLATEMAKLSLWLLTLARNKPFTFLDHSIRCGDSLIGLHDIEQLRHFSLKPHEEDAALFKGPLDAAVSEAIELRLKLEDMPSNTVEDVEAQEKLLHEADEKLARLRCAADLLVAGEFWGENVSDKQEKVRHAAVVSGHYIENGPTLEFRQTSEKELRGQRTFNWPLEFPEVVVNTSGFDAFLGNPPFMAGRAISNSFGNSYLEHLKFLVGESVGQTDLCAYFFRRAFDLVNRGAAFGFVATNSICQGDSSEIALSRLISSGAKIFRAVSSQAWPGEASVFISLVHVYRGSWSGNATLNGTQVDLIDSKLQSISNQAPPGLLADNKGKSFKGFDIGGLGFTLTPDEYQNFLDENPDESSVIHPYINGRDFYSSPTQKPSRYAINFVDMSLKEATRFPASLDRIRQLVKPQRDKVKRKRNRERWWLYSENRPGMRAAIAGYDRVLVKTQTSKTWAFAFLPCTYLFDQKLVVFPTTDFSFFATLQSELHYFWAERQGSSLKGDMAYTPTDCFQTFPFPMFSKTLSGVGHQYNELRSEIMSAKEEGLTQTHNRLVDQADQGDDICEMRKQQLALDCAVAEAYGWDDLDLGHGFHETKQGVRYTISKSARRDILQRLLKLNHERYEEEVKQGLHDKKKKRTAKKTRKSRPKKSKAAAGLLFDDEG